MLAQRRGRSRRARDHTALDVEQNGGGLAAADGGFEQLDQPPSLGQCLLLQMALQLADQRHDERPSLPIDRIWRPGDVDHADDAPVERIADYGGGAAPGLGDLAEVFLGMDVERTAERQRRAHRIGAAAALVPRGARNDVVSGQPVGEMRIAVDRQQGAVGIAGDPGWCANP